MTQEDKERYDSLSPEEKESYDFYSRRHPEWEAHQIFSMIGIEFLIEKLPEKGPEELGTNNTIIQKNILEKLDDWFVDNYPDLHSKVSPFIQNAINKLSQLIAKGVKIVKSIYETLKELFT